MTMTIAIKSSYFLMCN